jgi:pyruvate, orthophosphate dikinase
MLERVESLHEANPMLGLRGVRLGILLPGLTRMQVRAIFEAACDVAKDGVDVHPKIMIPLTSHVNELSRAAGGAGGGGQGGDGRGGHRDRLRLRHHDRDPARGPDGDEIAEHAEFISFGTNDLTQMTFGISRDDAEKAFLVQYLEKGILERNPFATIDPGVGELMRVAIEKGPVGPARPGTPASAASTEATPSRSPCAALGVDYVSCSPPGSRSPGWPPPRPPSGTESEVGSRFATNCAP